MIVHVLSNVKKKYKKIVQNAYIRDTTYILLLYKPSILYSQVKQLYIYSSNFPFWP